MAFAFEIHWTKTSKNFESLREDCKHGNSCFLLHSFMILTKNELYYFMVLTKVRTSTIIYDFLFFSLAFSLDNVNHQWFVAFFGHSVFRLEMSCDFWAFLCFCDWFFRKCRETKFQEFQRIWKKIQHFKRRTTWTVRFLVRQSHKILNDFSFFIGRKAVRLVFLEILDTY